MSNKINKELDNVNAGYTPVEATITCPKCGTKFGQTNTVMYVSGCDEEIYYKCPSCGHEFDL